MSDRPGEEEVEESCPIDQSAPVLTGRFQDTTSSSFGIATLVGRGEDDEGEEEEVAADEVEDQQEEVLLVIDPRGRVRSHSPPPASPLPPSQEEQEQQAAAIADDEDDVGPLKYVEFRPPPMPDAGAGARPASMPKTIPVYDQEAEHAAAFKARAPAPAAPPPPVRPVSVSVSQYATPPATPHVGASPGGFHQDGGNYQDDAVPPPPPPLTTKRLSPSEDEEDDDAYIGSTHELILKDFSKSGEESVTVWIYRSIGWVILVSEVLIMVEAFIQSIKCTGQSSIPWRHFWLAVPSCAIYASGTAIDEFYQYELVRSDIKKSRRSVWLLFRTLLASIQMLMLCTCAAVMGNSPDVLSLVSNYLGVQVITQVDEIFAAVLKVPNPERHFYVREDQQELSRRISLIARRKGLFWTLLGLTTFFAFMIRSPYIGCVRADGAAAAPITDCAGVYGCFDSSLTCPFTARPA